MKISSTLCLCLLFGATLLSAQARPHQGHSPFGQIYRLSTQEARTILRGKPNLPFQEAWLHSPVDTFQGLAPTRTLPAGYYLLARAREETVTLSVHQVTPLHLQVIPHHRDMLLSLQDDAGQAMLSARMLLRGRLVQWDSSAHLYRLPRQHKGGFLEIYTDDGPWFGWVDPLSGYANWRRRWQYFSSHGIGKVLTTPFRWSSRAISRLHSGLHSQHRRYRAWENQFSGYLAFSKPKYQPGDTLQVKAYLSTPKGRAWQKPVEVTVQQERPPYPLVCRQTIRPQSPGSYVFRLPLPDTLRLDMPYSVRFEELGKNENKTFFKEANFQYEAYQLDEYTYSLECSQTVFQPGEPVRLHLSATDANLQPIPDASVRLLLRTERINRCYGPEVYVPDTLWQLETPFSARGELALSVPDSIWPAADLKVNLQAFCRNSAGEEQIKSTSFVRVGRPAPLRIRVAKGFIVLEKSDRARVPDTAMLQARLANGAWHSQSVRLPARLRLAGNVVQYQVQTGADLLEVPLPTAPVAVTHEGFRQQDSAFFSIGNPHQVPLQLQVFENQHLLFETTTADSVWTWKKKASPAAFYRLWYTFLWQGKVETQQARAEYYAKLLNLTLEQPENIAPGQQVQVKIKVTDARGRPARNIDLTAAAYNRQFGDNVPYQTPGIAYSPGRYPFWKQRSSLRDTPLPVFSSGVNRAWYERLRLDQVLYYRLRYEGLGLHSERIPIERQDTAGGAGPGWGLPRAIDSFYQHRPQFAPYLIRANQAQPIYLIYCNNRLVYYHGASGQHRNSYFGWYGYNQIRLRTRDAEYILDSVYLVPGKKLEIALDGDRYAAAPLPVRREPRPDTLTRFEQELLRKTMLLWRPSASEGLHYCWSGPEDIQVASPNYSRSLQVLGPFSPGFPLHFLRSGDFYSAFAFEPGFAYSLAPGRERLFQTQWPQPHTRLPKQLPAMLPGEFAWGPQHIQVQRPQTPPIRFQSAGTDRPGWASLQLQGLQADTLLALALLSDTLLGPFSPTQPTLHNLPPGHYRLLLYGRQGYLHDQYIRLRRDTVLSLDLRTAAFHWPAPELRLEKLFPSPGIPVSDQPASSLGSRFSQWPGAAGEPCGIHGILTDDTGEVLIGASVTVRQGGILIGGTITNLDGEYCLSAPEGVYDLEFSYTGYHSSRVSGVFAMGGMTSQIDQSLQVSSLLNEVVVVGYGVPLIQQDQTTVGHTIITSQQIKLLETRNLNAIIATPAGANIPKNAGDPFVRSATADGEAPVQLRSRFSDYAYWQPSLRSDRNGEAWFQATFPDNITSWEAYVIGMGRGGRAGFTAHSIRSFKPLAARLAIPRFAIAGDRFEAVGLSTQLNADSIDIGTVFRLDGRLLRESRHRITEGLTEFATVDVPAAGADSLLLSYEVRSEQTSDGEARQLPILPLGAQESNGQFLILEADTTVTLAFDPALGPVQVQVQNNALDLMLDDIRFLRDYPYDCNEQISSRLLALLLEKKLAAAPQNWLNIPPRDRSKSIALREKEIRTCLQGLHKAQLPDGCWGWWPGGQPNAWMTRYVLRALLQAKTDGYTSEASEKGLIWLRHEIGALPQREQMDALLVLREAGVQLDVAPFLKRLDTLPRRSTHDRLLYWRLRQRCGQPVPADSLRAVLLPTTTGGLYCGPENADWYERRAIATLLAYDIAEQAGLADITAGIRRFWLESPRAARQQNTIETAQVLQRLLPALPGSNSHCRLKINELDLNTFPQRLTFPEGTSSLHLQKSDGGPLYLSAWQAWQNAQPAPREDWFAATTWFEQNHTRSDMLRQGEATELVLDLRVSQSADYVLLEIPIPAGCTYGDKRPLALPDVHREYFRDRVVVFCETLPVGQYQFRVALEPRFSGQFTLNPVRVEQQYFPVFFGRNAVKNVRIGRE